MSDNLTNALNSLSDQNISLNNLGMSDSHPSGLDDQFPISNFDNTDIFHNLQADYSLPDSANHHYQQPDYHQSAGYGDELRYGDSFAATPSADRTYDIGTYDISNMRHEHHSLNFDSEPRVMYSSSHHHCPYTTISDNGMIYKHTSDSSIASNYVGYLNGRSVYNSSNYYLGYAGTDGKVYDNYDHYVGWTDGCHVYNKAGVEVYETTRSEQEMILQRDLAAYNRQTQFALATYQRETAFLLPQVHKIFENWPLTLVPAQILDSHHSNRVVPLRVVISPPEVDFDRFERAPNQHFPKILG
ncbi:MAG TPA: hypothetical protein DD379_14000 [Cyanobacteria bacterium UBA11162]|nr:hypothetical protein [Cyanobacteria bacterium UBA11162]